MNAAYDLADKFIDRYNIDTSERDRMACEIKKMNHGEKLSVYHRIFLSMKHGPRRPKTFKKHIKRFIRKEVEHKIETHREFSRRDYSKQIHGIFNWKK